MGLLSFFYNQGEKRRQKLMEKGICPDCSGRGTFSSGLESVYIQDCSTCDGTGKA